MSALLNNDLLEKIKELGTTLTIYGYSLNGIRQVEGEEPEQDYLYCRSRNLSGFYDEQEKTLHLLVTEKCDSDISIIKFYFEDRFDNDEDNQDLSYLSVDIDNYLSDGRNVITIKLPDTTKANIIVSGNQQHELEGFGNNPGSSIFRNYEGDKEVSLRSFENYIESKTTSFYNPRYQAIDDSGQEISKNNISRVYSNLKISCQGLDYNYYIPTRADLSYYGGEIRIFGTADYIEYQELGEGYDKIEISKGTEEIESIQGIELVKENEYSGFLSISGLTVKYPVYSNKKVNTDAIYAKLGDLVSEKIRFTYRHSSPEFQILEESTEVGEYYHEFGVVPVYLFEHNHGSTNSFTLQVKNFSKDKITVENFNTDLFEYSVKSENDKYTVTIKTLQENSNTIDWQPKELGITLMHFGTFVYRFCLIQKANLSSFDLYDSTAGLKYENEILIPYSETSTELRLIPDDNNIRDTWFVLDFEDFGNGFRQISEVPESGKFGETIELNTSSYIPNTVWEKNLGKIKLGRSVNVNIDYWKLLAQRTEKEYKIIKAGIEPEFELVTNYMYNHEQKNRVVDNARIVLDEINVYGFTVRSNGPFICYVDSENIDFLVNNNEHTKIFYSSNYDNVEGINIYIAERKNDSTKGYQSLGKIIFGIPKKENFELLENYVYKSEDFLFEKEYKVTTGREIVESNVEYVDKNYMFVDNNTTGTIEFTSTRTPKYKVFDVLGDEFNINSVVLISEEEVEEQKASGNDSSSITATVYDYQNIQDLGELKLGDVEDVMYCDRRYIKHQQLISSTFDSMQQYYYPSSIRSIVREYNQENYKDFYIFCKKLSPKLLRTTDIDLGNVAFLGSSNSITFEILSRYIIETSDIKFIDVNSIYTTQIIVSQQEETIENNIKGDSNLPEPEQNQIGLVIDCDPYNDENNDYRYRYNITVNLNPENITKEYIGTLRIRSRIYNYSIISLEKKGKYASYIPESLDIDQNEIDSNIEYPSILDIGIYRGYPKQIDVFPHGSVYNGSRYVFNVSALGETKEFQAVPKNKVGEIGGDAELIEGFPDRFKLTVPSLIPKEYVPRNTNFAEFYNPDPVYKFVGINNKPEDYNVISFGDDTLPATRTSDTNNPTVSTPYDREFNFEFNRPGIHYGLFASSNNTKIPLLYLGGGNNLRIEVEAGTSSLRLFVGVLSLGEDSHNQRISNIIPEIESENLEYNWILNSNGEYTSSQPNLELRFPINTTDKYIIRSCKFSYKDNNSGITHELKIIITQKNYYDLLVYPKEIYFDSSGNYLGKDSSDIIYRFEYMYSDTSNLTLEVSEDSNILLEEPIAIIPNPRIQAETPGFYVYDAYIKLKPNYTNTFLNGSLEFRNNNSNYEKISIYQGYKCSILSPNNSLKSIYSKQVLGSFDNPIYSFSSSHGSVEFIVKQQRQEYVYIDGRWHEGIVDKSFDQLIYVSSIYKYSTTNSLIQEQNVINYVGLSSYLNSGTGSDKEPYVKIVYDFDIKDQLSEFYIIPELSVKGYFLDGTEPVSTYKIYIKKESMDKIYADDFMYYCSDGFSVKEYTFESYYDDLDNTNIEFDEKYISLGISKINSNNDRYTYKINLVLYDNKTGSDFTGVLNIKRNDKVLKQITIQQGYRCSYVVNPTTKEIIYSGEISTVDVLKTGKLIFQIYQERKEFDEFGEFILTSDFDVESQITVSGGLSGATSTSDSINGTVTWNFTNLADDATCIISFTRYYEDINTYDYSEFIFTIVCQSYDDFVYSEYNYIDDTSEISVNFNGDITYSFGSNIGNSLEPYKISLPFKLKLKRNTQLEYNGGNYKVCKLSSGEQLTPEELNAGCVLSKKLDIEFPTKLEESQSIGFITVYLTNGTSKFVILDITTTQQGSELY